MKVWTVAFTVILFISEGMAVGSRFMGPDSANWQAVVQMDVSFHQGENAIIGVGTPRGVCVRSGGSWRYVAPDLRRPAFYHPQHLLYREIHFSPWSDGMAFLGYNTLSGGVRGSSGSIVPDIASSNWSGNLAIAGGSGAYNPTLGFVFSPRIADMAFSWIGDLYLSTNGGSVWAPKTGLGSYGALFVAVDEVYDSVLYAARQVGGQSPYRLYRSSNNGSNWTSVRQLSVNLPSDSAQHSGDMIANGDTLIFALNRLPKSADDPCGIYVSKDGGSTWSQPVTHTNVQRIVRDPNDHNALLAAAEGTIYRSHTGGVTWDPYITTLPSPNIVDIRKDPYSDTIYVATSDMGVYALYDLPASVDAGAQKPVAFTLQQNFPNPFNPSTMISFDLPRRSHVVLTVHDLLGRTVSTLVDGIEESGRHDVSFPGGDLASGIYFYRIQAEGVSQVRKMILQK